MPYCDPAARAAYRKGANDCYTSSIPYLKATVDRAIVAWLKELDAWEVGDPPNPPSAW